MNSKGGTRKINHSDIVAFAGANPGMRQDEIASKFRVAQSRVSTILASAGVSGIRRGAPVKPKPGQSSEAYQWEKILHDAGLGMDRGLRIKNQRILYGYDHKKETFGDSSATISAS
jgi:hypothetical protein